MTIQVRGLVCAAVVFAFFTLPAAAQGASDFFGAFESIIKLSQQQEEQKRQKVVAVKRLQSGLARLGFYRGRIDGDLGSATQEALSAYYISIGRNTPYELSIVDVEFVESQARLVSAPSPSNDFIGENNASYNPLSPPGPIRQLKAVPKGAALNLKHVGEGVWIVVASRDDLENALAVAQDFAKDFWSTIVARSSNSRYAVIIGWIPREQAVEFKEAFQSQSIIPSDTFLSVGEKFGHPVWSIDAKHIETRRDLLRYSLIRPSPTLLNVLAKQTEIAKNVSKYVAQVHGLSNPASDYLSLRRDPSIGSAEVRKLPEGTPLQIVVTRGDWYQVNLLNGVTGWVSAKYVQPQTSDNDNSDEDNDTSAGNQNSAVDQVLRDKIISDATTFRDDVDIFLKQNPDIPDILAIAEEMARLQTGLNSVDLPKIEAAVSSLKSRMTPLQAFAVFQSERQQSRAAAEMEALGEAVRVAKRNNYFLTRYVAQNVTSPSIPQLLPILNDYKSAMIRPTLGQLTEINARLDRALAKENLRDQYQKIASGYVEPNTQPATASDALGGENKITLTEKNKEIFEGDGKELIMLFNNEAAPHVVKNLRGDIVFDQGKANVCYLHGKPSRVVDGAIVELLGTIGAKEAQPIGSPCVETKLLSYDVLIGFRSDILIQKQDYIYPLLSLMEKGSYQVLRIVPSHELKSMTDEDGSIAKSFEDGIDKGTMPGFGLIRTENSSKTICSTAPSQAEGHRLAIEDKRDQIENFIERFSVSKPSNLDEAFKLIKRGQCGALYGDAKDLKLLLDGMRRDNLHYKVVPIWITQNDVESSQKRALELNEAAAQADAALKREIEDKANLESKRANDLASTKDAREKALHSQYGALARARAEEVINQFNFMLSRENNWFSSSFERTASWYSNQISDGWEFVDVQYRIADYGTSKWKDRSLSTAFVDLNVSMKNRLLGENKTFCFNLGVIFDDEFSTLREPIEASCDTPSRIVDDWKRGWSFASQWNVSE